MTTTAALAAGTSTATSGAGVDPRCARPKAAAPAAPTTVTRLTAAARRSEAQAQATRDVGTHTQNALAPASATTPASLATAADASSHERAQPPSKLDSVGFDGRACGSVTELERMLR